MILFVRENSAMEAGRPFILSFCMELRKKPTNQDIWSGMEYGLWSVALARLAKPFRLRLRKKLMTFRACSRKQLFNVILPFPLFVSLQFS